MSKAEFELSTTPSQALLKGENTLNESNGLTEEETKKILTRFAFNIDESLLGIPLAVPWRRGLALLIDFILIAILSGAPGELLAIVVAITFYRIGSSKPVKQGSLKDLGECYFDC